MRYELNDDGYISKVFFGCYSGSCVEYTGTIPDGYESLEIWEEAEEDKLGAWKIVDGNLVFDENKYNELQAQWTIEEEENTLSTHGWTRELLEKNSSVVTDEFSNSVTGSSLIVIEDSGEYDIPKIVASSSETISGKLKVVVSNKNILGNKAVTTTTGGITFTINSDKSITLNGTSTKAIEFILDGTLTNTEMLFLIKENTDYIKSGLADNVSLDLYNYDGTDTTLVSNGGNGTINLSTRNIITCSSLSIATGITFDNVTISPQIEVDDTASSYIEHKENSIIVKLSKNKANIKNKLNSYDPTTVIMIDKVMDLEVNYFKYKTINSIETNIEVLEDSIESSVSDIKEKLNDVGEAIETINSTMMKQTSEAFEMLFTQTGIEDTVNTIQNMLNDNTTDINTISQYIHFEGGIITLGASDSQSKLIIQKDRISFMTGDSESAYISQNQLYITDSTILRKLQVGRWITQEDEYGNLNTKWEGGE